MDYLNKTVVAVLVINSLDGLTKKINDLVEQGFRVFEVTLRTNCALKAIKKIKTEFPLVKVGAGTILTLEQFYCCVDVNADFGVAPGFNKEIVRAAKDVNFKFIPGVATPSEIELAISMDVELVKIFPAKLLGGIAFIKAISGPYSKMMFMPTGGVSEADYLDYLALPQVACVGGTWMGAALL